MRKPSVRFDEENSDSHSTITPNSNQAYFDEYSSSYLHDNSAESDSESFSDSSRKIRKKRSTYQKISDEIRMDLLESVKNGETLKSAAKRHKINYSSAKSILHTFRKEGRILKKSAQERTTKKKSIDFLDSDQPSKNIKTPKKDKLASMAKTRDFTTSLAAISEGNKSELMSNGFSDESSPLSSVNALKVAFSNQMKIENYDNQVENSKASTLASISNHYGYPEHDDSKFKPNNNYYMHYYDAPATETSVDHMLNSGPSYPSYSFLPNDMGSFGDLTSAYQTRPYHNEEIYSDPSAFLSSKGYNMPYGSEDREMRMGGHGMDGEGYGYMDTQKILKDALSKAPTAFGGHHETTVRKDSIDLYF